MSTQTHWGASPSGVTGGDGVWKPRPRERPALPAPGSRTPSLQGDCHTHSCLSPICGAPCGCLADRSHQAFYRNICRPRTMGLEAAHGHALGGVRKLLCPLLCKPALPWGSCPTPCTVQKDTAACASQPALPWPGLGWETPRRRPQPGGAPWRGRPALPLAPSLPGREASTTVSFTLPWGWIPRLRSPPEAMNGRFMDKKPCYFSRHKCKRPSGAPGWLLTPTNMAGTQGVRQARGSCAAGPWGHCPPPRRPPAPPRSTVTMSRGGARA